MSKVRYTIRLYPSHDLDLITFMLTHEFDIPHAVYCALTAFAKEEAFVIQIPPAIDAELPNMRRVYTRALTLDEEKDTETVALLAKIKPGKRNNFLKNLLRLYLMYPFSEEFFVDKDDAALFEKKLAPLRARQREARAGKVKKSKHHQIFLQKDGISKEMTASHLKDDSAIEPDSSTHQKPDTAPPNTDDVFGIFSNMLGQ